MNTNMYLFGGGVINYTSWLLMKNIFSFSSLSIVSISLQPLHLPALSLNASVTVSARGSRWEGKLSLSALILASRISCSFP